MPTNSWFRSPHICPHHSHPLKCSPCSCQFHPPPPRTKVQRRPQSVPPSPRPPWHLLSAGLRALCASGLLNPSSFLHGDFFFACRIQRRQASASQIYANPFLKIHHLLFPPTTHPSHSAYRVGSSVTDSTSSIRQHTL